MNRIDFEQRLREWIDQLDKEPQALRAAGREKEAAECERKNASIRRKLERTLAELPDRMAAADARDNKMLSDLIEEIKRTLD